MWVRIRESSGTLVTGGIVALTILASLPILVGRWSLIVPYWYNAATLPLDFRSLAPGLLALALYLAGNRILARRSGPLVVGWSLAGALIIPAALLAVVGPPAYVLFTRTASPQTTGAFTLGTSLTPATLHAWPQLMPGWRQYLPHMAISLPGWPLLYHGLSQLLAQVPGVSRPLADILRPWQCHNWDWGLNQATDGQLAAAWFGMVSPVWAALTVLPLYGFAKRAAGATIARRAVRWWPLVPALALFAGTPNTVYPLFTMAVLYLLWLAMTAGPGWFSTACLLVTGLLIGGLLLLNLSLAPLLLLGGLVICLSWRAVPDRSLRSHAGWCLVAGLEIGLGLLVACGAYALWLGGSPVEAFVVAMRLHLNMHRSYLPNLGLHAWDFAIYTGLAATGLALACMAGMRRIPAVSRLALAFGLTMLTLLLSGSAQGEVGRVWIFFMPVVLLLAASAMQQLSPRQRQILLGAQVFWLVVLAASHRPVDTWLGPPPAYAAVARPSLVGAITPVQATFSDDLRLTGFQSQYDPARRAVTLALHWQPLRQMTAPYYFSIVPVAPGGQALPGVHWQPFGKLYPTTCWRPEGSGGEVVDQVELPLGDAPASGDWWLSLSAFAMAGDQAKPPLPVNLGDGTQDKQFGLGPVTVHTAQ